MFSKFKNCYKYFLIINNVPEFFGKTMDCYTWDEVSNFTRFVTIHFDTGGLTNPCIPTFLARNNWKNTDKARLGNDYLFFINANHSFILGVLLSFKVCRVRHLLSFMYLRVHRLSQIG